MEELNNQEKQNYEIMPQSKNEIEPLNDNEELDLESLEEIAGGGWGCNCKKKKKNPDIPFGGGGEGEGEDEGIEKKMN